MSSAVSLKWSALFLLLAGCSKAPSVDMETLCAPFGGFKEYGWETTRDYGRGAKVDIAAYCQDGSLVSRSYEQ